MERLAADFSANPEQILPEAGALETGRSYREKKAKPLLAKIVKVLWALYLAYVELKGKFERLQTDYGQNEHCGASFLHGLIPTPMNYSERYYKRYPHSLPDGMKLTVLVSHPFLP